jgi:hypothetical protein
MGDVLVKGARMAGDRIEALTVEMQGLPVREIDRATAIAWMRDGHSFIPFLGSRLPSLLLVSAGNEAFIRNDSQSEAADSLPELG